MIIRWWRQIMPRHAQTWQNEWVPATAAGNKNESLWRRGRRNCRVFALVASPGTSPNRVGCREIYHKLL